MATVTMILKVFGMLFAATLLHELGHAFFLKLYKVKIKRIQIFYLDFVEFNFNSFKFSLGILPTGGFTEIKRHTMRYLDKTEIALIFLGGIFATAFLALMSYLFFGFCLFFWINIAKLVLNLLPLFDSDIVQVIKVYNGTFERIIGGKHYLSCKELSCDGCLPEPH